MISFGVEGVALVSVSSARSAAFVEDEGAETGASAFCVDCETGVDGAPFSGVVFGSGAICREAWDFAAVFSSR